MGRNGCNRRRSDERGVIGLIPAIIALLTGGAIAVATVMAVNAANSNKKKKDPDVFLRVNDISATRDAKDRPHINVKFTIAIGDAQPESFVPESKVQCFVTEQGSKQRAFIGETGLLVPINGSRDGALTITPRESDSDVQGPVRVRCDLTRFGRTFSVKTVTINVPSPNGQPTGTSADANDYVGKYQAAFTLVQGVAVNCDPPSRRRSFVVKALDSSHISFELGPAGSEILGISSFGATLSKTAQFSGEVLLNPGESSWQGLLTGTFTKDSAGTAVRGRYTRDDGHCAFDYIAVLAKSSDAGTLRISLEEIPGVDGCVASLSASRIPAGHVVFVVTNNTFGFAQIFVYDAEHNAAAYNKQTIPQRGGTGTFTGELVPGSYDVACDGPGGQDQTVKLTVE